MLPGGYDVSSVWAPFRQLGPPGGVQPHHYSVNAGTLKPDVSYVSLEVSRLLLRGTSLQHVAIAAEFAEQVYPRLKRDVIAPLFFRILNLEITSKKSFYLFGNRAALRTSTAADKACSVEFQSFDGRLGNRWARHSPISNFFCPQRPLSCMLSVLHLTIAMWIVR